MKDIKARSNCPVSYSLDFFGDKWTLLILRDMMIANKSTYGEFLTSEEKIATNILADRLSMLEANGFVTRQVAPDKKSKIIYNLTDKAIALLPVVMEMGIWGSQYNPPGLDKELLEALQKDKQGTILKYQQQLKERISATNKQQAQ